MRWRFLTTTARPPEHEAPAAPDAKTPCNDGRFSSDIVIGFLELLDHLLSDRLALYRTIFYDSPFPFSLAQILPATIIDGALPRLTLRLLRRPAASFSTAPEYLGYFETCLSRVATSRKVDVARRALEETAGYPRRQSKTTKPIGTSEIMPC